MMICKKKILSAMVLMGTASTLMAQTTVKGRVTDQNGEPVIGATVSLNGQTKSLSVTDVNGGSKCRQTCHCESHHFTSWRMESLRLPYPSPLLRMAHRQRPFLRVSPG